MEGAGGNPAAKPAGPAPTMQDLYAAMAQFALMQQQNQRQPFFLQPAVVGGQGNAGINFMQAPKVPAPGGLGQYLMRGS